ncbi:alpha/beta fold hydrolase [Variovorax sp. J22G73]|uniref:esterase/lipase family protein n=1 Tax=unclassified Variovorax TaxID=663243 RepID=UPI0025775AC9|nr:MULTISPECIES: alpha/beta fold hydrolase [unclassified Variovorax]MDM0009535.1 alpha/beta fold hydrolase [Variovorax sp. J22R203]MDM0102043.1 alpha/beta fold hydrolase [Variovorax sp. J22G73]
MNYAVLPYPYEGSSTGRSASPSAAMLLAEGRAVFEFGAGLALWPLLQLAPQGDGHPVLVLPGFLAGNASTLVLRRYLRSVGYDAQGWRLGVNLGYRQKLISGMLAQLEELSRDSQRKVSIVGWSLGGVYARLLAARHPELVRSVITLGSPISGGPDASNAKGIYQTLNGRRMADSSVKKLVAQSLEMPATSIYSRSDGVVFWRASVIPVRSKSENIEVHGTHIGLGGNPAVLYAAADRLSQPEGAWAPFRGSGLAAIAFPDPARPA